MSREISKLISLEGADINGVSHAGSEYQFRASLVCSVLSDFAPRTETPAFKCAAESFERRLLTGRLNCHPAAFEPEAAPPLPVRTIMETRGATAAHSSPSKELRAVAQVKIALVTRSPRTKIGECVAEFEVL